MKRILGALFLLSLLSACGPSSDKKDKDQSPAPAQITEVPVALLEIPRENLVTKITVNQENLDKVVLLEKLSPLDCFFFGEEIYKAFLIVSRARDPKSSLPAANGNFPFGDLGGGKMVELPRCPLMIPPEESSWRKTYASLQALYASMLPLAQSGNLGYDLASYPRTRPRLKNLLDQVETFFGESSRELALIRTPDTQSQGKTLFQMGRVFALVDDLSRVVRLTSEMSKKELDVLTKIQNQMFEIRRELNSKSGLSKSLLDRIKALKKTAAKELGHPEV